MSLIRSLFLKMTLFSSLLLSGAYLLEYGWKMEPCSLCLLQRYLLWGVVLVSGLAVFSRHRFWQIIQTGLLLIFSISGALVAGRHLWIQYFASPETLQGCLAGFDQLFAYKPFFEALTEILTAPHDCAKIDFTFFKIPLSGWSLAGFGLLVGLSLRIGWLQIKRRI